MTSDKENVGELTKDNGRHCRIQEFKLTKRNAKSSMTSLLRICCRDRGERSATGRDKGSVGSNQRTERQNKENGEVGIAEKVSDEADDLVEQVDRETTCSAVRSALASLAKKGSVRSKLNR